MNKFDEQGSSSDHKAKSVNWKEYVAYSREEMFQKANGKIKDRSSQNRGKSKNRLSKNRIRAKMARKSRKINR